MGGFGSSFGDRSVRLRSLIGYREKKYVNMGNVPCSKTHFKLKQSPQVVRQQAALFVSQSQQQNSASFSKRIPAMVSKMPPIATPGQGDYIY